MNRQDFVKAVVNGLKTDDDRAELRKALRQVADMASRASTSVLVHDDAGLVTDLVLVQDAVNTWVARVELMRNE